MAYQNGLKSNAEWKRWGQDDPFWGVVSWTDKQKDGASPWTEDEVYALGESDFQDFVNQWRQYGLRVDSCLEIGCGVGRITRQLAATFQRVHAVDVSEEMIAHARRATGANAQFSLVDGLHLPQADGSVAAIFSVLVLQHLDDVEAGLKYFREFFRVMQAGGTLMIQVPVYSFPYHAKPLQLAMEAAHDLIRWIGTVRADIKRRAGSKLMRVTPFPINLLTTRLGEIGFRQVEIRMFSTKSNGDLYSFVFATK